MVRTGILRRREVCVRVLRSLNLVCIAHVAVRTRFGAVCAPFENEMGATRA